MTLGKKTLIAGTLVTALVATGAMAAKQRFGGEDRAAYITERVAERLDLNEAQKTSFENVAKKWSEIRGAQPEFMLELKEKLTELAKDETLTVEEVDTLRAEIKAEFDRRADIIVPEFVAFYNTLDSEQRAEIADRLDRMGGRFDKHGKRGFMGKWGGGHGHGERHRDNN